MAAIVLAGTIGAEVVLAPGLRKSAEDAKLEGTDAWLYKSMGEVKSGCVGGADAVLGFRFAGGGVYEG